MRSWPISSFLLILLTLITVSVPAMAAGPADAVLLHGDFDRLLNTYVSGMSVDYAAWSSHKEDTAALARYVETLAALDPADWPHDDGLAYWINMYNAVTLWLILDHYPIDSIKDIGGFMKKSAWKRKLVTVAGRELTLNDIENKIIRPTFNDPRIHFALNCASIGCPPLKADAYLPATISEQLDESGRVAMNGDRWVNVEDGKVRLTKIFDWYKNDFKVDGGSVEAFINRYRNEKVSSENQKFSFMSYDWSLNSTSSQ